MLLEKAILGTGATEIDFKVSTKPFWSFLGIWQDVLYSYKNNAEKIVRVFVCKHLEHFFHYSGPQKRCQAIYSHADYFLSEAQVTRQMRWGFPQKRLCWRFQFDKYVWLLSPSKKLTLMKKGARTSWDLLQSLVVPNPLQSKISMLILHTDLNTFPLVLKRRNCWIIKNIRSWWSIPFILLTLMCDSGGGGDILGKLDASHS